MFDRLFETIAPHHCYGCDKIGALLCDNCKYDISSERFSSCLACGETSSVTGVCRSCTVPYSRAWCVGDREGTLQKLIGGYKFQYARAANIPLAELISGVVGRLPRTTVIVPVPTVAAHIRERGFDHAALLARRVAVLQGVSYDPLLSRITSTKQRDAGREQRLEQAKTAFAVYKKVRSDIPYLLIDDVVTTGATMRFAAQVLKDAGASDVWAAAVARQTLD